MAVEDSQPGHLRIGERRMLEHLADGVSTAEAARLARADPSHRTDPAPRADPEPRAIPAPGSVPGLADALRTALNQFDDARAHALLDQLAGSYPLVDVLAGAVLPYLRDLGDRWERGEASVAQEHFASALLRGRLLALARGWGSGAGPRAILACVPGDQHDLGLICFGLALRAQGWRIAYLGPDTPLVTLIETADQLQPALVVVTATLPEQAAGAVSGLRELACVAPLALAGAGAGPAVAEAVGARYLDQDPVVAAAATASAAPATARARPSG